jgi:uncharacterized protein (DUF2252 family)
MNRLPASQTERASALAALRAKKVADAAHAFVRANAGFFYDHVSPRSLPTGPRIYICADCHSENIGAIAGDDEVPAIELNDFDESAIGEPAYDVLRLALALSFAGRTSGLGGIDTVHMVDAMLDGYGASLARRSERLPVREIPERFRRLIHRASTQTHTALLDRRVPRGPRGERAFLLGERYWPLSPKERAQIETLVLSKRVRKLVASFAGTDPEHVTMVDAAFRVAGTGSLGCFRAAALVHCGKHRRAPKKDDLGLRLLDIKEAIASHAPHAKKTPKVDAARIVAAACALAPSLGARMLPAAMGKRGVIVRDLMPQELKASLLGLEREEAPLIARFLGAVVGRAHARQLDRSDARAWRTEACDPRWILDALPSLVGAHEAAYLEHCVETIRERR